MSRSKPVSVVCTLALLGFVACRDRAQPERSSAALELGDDPHAFVTSSDYRRAIVERDLVERESVYARVRLRHYSRSNERGWDNLPIVDWPTLPLTLADAEHIARTRRLPDVQFGPPLSAAYGQEDAPVLPSTREQWIALGERVFFELPMVAAPSVGRALREGVDLRDYGLLVHDDAYVGVRLVQVEGHTRVALTCAVCHASIGADGRPSGVRANRNYDLGRLRLAHGGAHEPELVDETRAEDLDRLGPGRSDVQRDREFNPYAFPDFGGIVDMPYLHHTANWYHRGAASLAIRIETVYMSHGRLGNRRPRVLMWALAEYLRSLPAPPPVAAPSPASERGRAVFVDESCDACHAPPLYTSSERPTLDEIGTDPSAGTSPIRGTGRWRVPSLRGVGGNAPYLHDGSVGSLEQLFDPAREQPGHRFGLDLDAQARADLLAFLQTI